MTKWIETFISLAYVLLFLISGDLPWNIQKIAAIVKDLDADAIYGTVFNLKKSLNNDPEELQNLPPIIGQFLAANKCINNIFIFQRKSWPLMFENQKRIDVQWCQMETFTQLKTWFKIMCKMLQHVLKRVYIAVCLIQGGSHSHSKIEEEQ